MRPARPLVYTLTLQKLVWGQGIDRDADDKDDDDGDDDDDDDRRAD